MYHIWAKKESETQKCQAYTKNLLPMISSAPHPSAAAAAAAVAAVVVAAVADRALVELWSLGLPQASVLVLQAVVVQSLEQSSEITSRIAFVNRAKLMGTTTDLLHKRTISLMRERRVRDHAKTNEALVHESLNFNQV
jgi:hypothetical protein